MLISALFHAPIAQQVEHATVNAKEEYRNRRVRGSSPLRGVDLNEKKHI